MKKMEMEFDGEEHVLTSFPTFLNIYEIIAIRIGKYVINIDRDVFDEYYQKRKEDSVLVGFYHKFYKYGSNSSIISMIKYASRIKECVYHKIYSENYVKEKRDLKKIIDGFKYYIDKFVEKYKLKINKEEKWPKQIDVWKSEEDNLYRKNNIKTNNDEQIGIIAVIVLVISAILVWPLVPIIILTIIEVKSYKVRYTLKGKFLRYQLREYEKNILNIKAEEELTLEEAFYKKVLAEYPRK